MSKQNSLRTGRTSTILTASATSLALAFAAGCHRDPNVQKKKYLESGIRYENQGKLNEAVIQFSNALKVDKAYGDAHYQLAKTYIKMGTFMAGYSELMKTVDLDPNNVPARIDLGDMLLAGGVPDRAEAQAKAVLGMNANNADAHALLSKIAARKGDLPEATSEIQHAIQLDPSKAPYHTQLALLKAGGPQTPSTAAGNEASAEQELQKAVSLDPNDAQARLVLAAFLEKKGDRAGAEQQYQAAIKAAPTNLRARTALVGLYLRANDKGKAEQTLRQAAEDLPDNEDAASLPEQYYLQTHQLDQAQTVYADLSSKYGKSYPIKLSYARILLAKGDNAHAQSLADELAKSHAGDPKVAMLSAALLLRATKTDEALDLLQKAVKNTPDNVPLRLMLARTAEVKGDKGAAETNFREASRLEPKNVEAQQGLAQMANARGDWGQLTQIANNTIANHPDYPDAYLWRGAAEASQKDYAKAEADYQQALKLNPNSPVPLTQLGELRLRQQHGAEAVPYLERALEKNPNDSHALGLLVGNDLQQKQPAKAIARVQEQIGKSPQNGALQGMLAQLQLANRDFAAARDSAQKAMQLNPSDEGALQVYGQAQSSLGNPDAAIQAWQQWTDKHPKDSVATTMLGSLEEVKGDKAKAMELYKKSLAIDPGQPLASNNLAYLMVESGGNVDVALSLAQAARRALPNSPDTADTLAWVYYNKGTYLSAKDLLEEALKGNPNNASVHYHLGMTYGKLNDKANAELHLKKAASLDPNSPTGKDAAAALAKLG